MAKKGYNNGTVTEKTTIVGDDRLQIGNSANAYQWRWVKKSTLSTQVQADIKAEDNTFTGANVFPTMNIGSGNTVSGVGAMAQGEGCTASAECAHAEGRGTASEYASHAEGYGQASAECAHAEGSGTASEYASHAEGSGQASAECAHAEGRSTTASGNYAHAEGLSTTASALYSHASGYYSTARLRSQHAQANGRFAATGDSQRTSNISHKETTDATPIECLTSTSERYVLPAGYIMACTVTINGSNSDGTVAGFYKRQAYIKNIGGATALIGTVQTIGTDITIGAIGGIAITADDANDSLKVEVTGKADETIRWVCVIDALEVGH